MTAQQVGEQIQERIVPQLSELGLEAFVFVAYFKDGEGNLKRITFGADGANPAYADGLRGMQIMAAKWGAGQL